MNSIYHLLVTDEDIVHECVQMPSDTCDMTVCGHETKDLYRQLGTARSDGNFEVVSKPVTCIGCIAASSEAREKLLARTGRRVDFYA